MAKKKRREYRVKIDAFTPDTMPMARLAEYLADLAKMFGAPSGVHLIGVEDGSTTSVVLVDYEDEPKVRERLHAVHNKEAPEDAMRAAYEFNKRLVKDNGRAFVIDPVGRHVIKFPGRDKAHITTYGPFSQPGTLDGVLIGIGGKRDPVPVHLQDRSEAIHLCYASRALARQLAPHIFGPMLRVNGIGRWLRDADGKWQMEHFKINGFEELRETKLRDIVTKLRSISSPLARSESPIELLDNIRHGGRQRNG